MTEYFAVIDEDGVRSDAFATRDEAIRFLRTIALDRGYTDQQAEQLFLHGSAVVKVETKDGNVVFHNLSWRAPGKAAIREPPTQINEVLPEIVMAKAPPETLPLSA
jgi:hypothetical protein